MPTEHTDHPGLTATLRLPADEPMQVAEVRPGAWRAYWTRLVTGHERGHVGGHTVRVERLVVRDGVTGLIVTAPTLPALVEAVTALYATSDLDVPLFTDRAAA